MIEGYKANKELVSNIDSNQISNNGLPSLINAIQKAGGITQNANLRKVILKRRLPTEEPKYKIAEINLLELLFEGDQSRNPYLFDGDIIIELSATIPPMRTRSLLLESKISPTEINFTKAFSFTGLNDDHKIQKVEKRDVATLIWCKDIPFPFLVKRPPEARLRYASVLYMGKQPSILYSFSEKQQKNTWRKI